jgi:uncharacterized protein YaaR (DUF327 family)
MEEVTSGEFITFSDSMEFKKQAAAISQLKGLISSIHKSGDDAMKAVMRIIG